MNYVAMGHPDEYLDNRSIHTQECSCCKKQIDEKELIEMQTSGAKVCENCLSCDYMLYLMNEINGKNPERLNEFVEAMDKRDERKITFFNFKIVKA